MKFQKIILITIVGVLMNNPIFSQENSTILKTKKEFTNKIKNNRVTIKTFYKEPPSLYNNSTMILKGVSEGEFIEIKIQGCIEHFEHIKLKMDDFGKLFETEILHKFEQLSNQTLIIKSVLPEGIPVEKIKWKSQSGKEYEFIISENGKDGQETLIYDLE